MNLKLFVALLLTLSGFFSKAQGVGINAAGTPPDNSAILDVKSTTKGLLLPRMLQSERDLIQSPAPGLLIWQTDAITGLYYNAGTAAVPAWQQLGAQGPQGLQGDTGLQGPAGPSNTSEFFHGYSVNSQTINNNSAIIFSPFVVISSGLSFGVNFITVGVSGYYKIDFAITATAANLFYITVNGNIITASRAGYASANEQNRGSAIVQLQAGDVVRIVNGGAAAVSLSQNQGGTQSVNASLTMIKL